MLWIILTLASAVLFAAKDVLAKQNLKHRSTPFQLTFEEAILTILLVVIFFWKHIEFDILAATWFFFIAKAFAMVATLYFYLTLLKEHELSIVAPLMNLSPAVLIVLSYLVLAESISTLQFFGIFLIIGSTLTLEWVLHHHHLPHPHLGLSTFKSKKMIFFVKASVMLVIISVLAILDKTIFSYTSSVYTNFFFTYVPIAVFSLIILLYKGIVGRTMSELKKRPRILAQHACNITSNYLILLAIALPTSLISLVIPMRRTSTLISAFFGGLFFHERHMRMKMFFVAVMIVGILLIAL
ncbi:MAG: EamA family transporter [Nanoarchaeota archaeon]